MTRIAVLMALVVEHSLGRLQDLRRSKRFFGTADWGRARLGGRAT